MTVVYGMGVSGVQGWGTGRDPCLCNIWPQATPVNHLTIKYNLNIEIYRDVICLLGGASKTWRVEISK